MEVKFENSSTIKTIKNNNDVKRSRRSELYYYYYYTSPCKELLDTYGIKLNWYQGWYLRFLDTKLMRWVYRFKRYGR